MKERICMFSIHEDSQDAIPACYPHSGSLIMNIISFLVIGDVKIDMKLVGFQGDLTQILMRMKIMSEKGGKEVSCEYFLFQTCCSPTMYFLYSLKS